MLTTLNFQCFQKRICVDQDARAYYIERFKKMNFFKNRGRRSEFEFEPIWARFEPINFSNRWNKIMRVSNSHYLNDFLEAGLYKWGGWSGSWIIRQKCVSIECKQFRIYWGRESEQWSVITFWSNFRTTGIELIQERLRLETDTTLS